MPTPSASAAPPEAAPCSRTRRRCDHPGRGGRASRWFPRSGRRSATEIGSSGDLVIWGSGGKHVRENEAVAMNDLAGLNRDRVREHRTGVRERMKFSALAAGIDGSRKIVEEPSVEVAACERLVENPWIDTR